MEEKKEEVILPEENVKKEDINIPIIYHNVLYEIPLKEIEYSKGKKSLIRQYIDELPYQSWSFCKHYQYESCLFGEDCWNVHVNLDYWKSILKKTKEKKEGNKIIENLLLKNNGNKENKKEISFISVRINQNNIQKIPIEVIVPTKKSIELKEVYEKNKHPQQKQHIGIWCHMYHRSLCKFGNQCNKIHIQHWFMEKIKENK